MDATDAKLNFTFMSHSGYLKGISGPDLQVMAVNGQRSMIQIR